jgi:uncharacterized membrane protein
MLSYLLSYIATLFLFLSIDFVWLKWMAGPLFQKHVPHLLADPVKPLPAILFYTIYAVSILVFVVYPCKKSDESLLYCLLFGAFFGFTAYATFDFTAASVFKNYPMSLALMDSLWGAFVTAMTSICIFYLHKSAILH